MKIIDFEKKGNVVRFYLGEETPEWGWTNPDYKYPDGSTPEWLKPEKTYWGDDWDDYPYECNAGRVYDEFVKGHKDISFGFDTMVLEPCDGYPNSEWSKKDMIERKVPCLIVIPPECITGAYSDDSFAHWVCNDKVIKYYFGDEFN